MGRLIHLVFLMTAGMLVEQEFEVASIKANAPQTSFHFAADAVSGGPGTDDAGVFRCSQCTLATLIAKAFQLQPYQFPGRTAVSGSTYDVVAKVPAGTSVEDFSAMLQNLLKERFGLRWHFEEKSMRGYQLVAAKGGPKLVESAGEAVPRVVGRHGASQGESHTHSGAMVFGASATYRAANRTMEDLARVLSDQLELPVRDETGLRGKYDISLRWSGAVSSGQGTHSDGASFGGAGHGGHGGGGGPSSGPKGDAAGPGLSDALQEQLGLKLVRAEQAMARLFVIDKVAQRPTEN